MVGVSLLNHQSINSNLKLNLFFCRAFLSCFLDEIILIYELVSHFPGRVEEGSDLVKNLGNDSSLIP